MNIEKRLAKVTERIHEVREQIRISKEQLPHWADVADDARMDALINESPLSERVRQNTEVDLERQRRNHAKLISELDGLMEEQNRLLDRLSRRE